MILTAGPPEAISSTDETSLPHAGMTVAINAQVIREFPQDWYYTLLQRAPQHHGELKSKVIVDVYFGLPEYERRKILTTLKAVRIHITDPRPYAYAVDERLADIVQDHDVRGFLARRNPEQRQTLRRARSELITHDMWRHAPSYQLRIKHLVYEYRAGLCIWSDHPWQEVMVDDGRDPFPTRRMTPFDASQFERPNKASMNVFATHVCKSETVFCDAVDHMDALLEDNAEAQWLAIAPVIKALAEAHAFDVGHHDEVAWVGTEREEVAEWIDPHRRSPVTLGRLYEADSAGSFLLQAADFASAIAREYWYRHNSLPKLVDTFDYVTYNGRRICESQAVSIQADINKRGKATIQQRG